MHCINLKLVNNYFKTIKKQLNGQADNSSSIHIDTIAFL